MESNVIRASVLFFLPRPPTFLLTIRSTSSVISGSGLRLSSSCCRGYSFFSESSAYELHLKLHADNRHI